MTAHRVNRDLGEAVRLGFGIGRNPGTGNTLDLEGKSGIAFVLSAGTYTAPNSTAGTMVMIIATGTVAIRTVSSSNTVLALSSGEAGFLIATSSTAWSSTALQTTSSADLTNAKYTTSAVTTSTTPAAGALTGARHVFWENTANGAVEVTTRTGAQLYADVPGSSTTASWLLTIVNRGDNTVTLTGGEDVNISGEVTIATLTTRTYVCRYNGTDAVLMQSVNKGTIET